MSRVTYALPVDYLRSILRYDPLTGILHWIKPRAGRKLGQAGSPRPNSYLNICIDRNRYLAHRIAWAMYYGEWPTIIDHINGNPVDNRIANLRNVTDRVNQQNHAKHRNGRLVGATRCSDGKWQGRIEVDGKRVHLGRFRTEREAHQAYVHAVKILEKIESGAVS